MRFGLFDHIDRADRPLAQQFDERLELIAAADEAGFYCYHVAEHHATPLNTVPSPSVFLGAVARLTRQIRLGPMVYVLPFHSPLRLIEEICILDHLCRGRLEVGVGRGTSPFEFGFYNMDYEDSRERFVDGYACLVEGLTQERLTHVGTHYTYRDVPIALRPFQQPYPRFWYGSTRGVGAAWAGEHGMHFTTAGPVALAESNLTAFSEALAARGGPAMPCDDFPGGTVLGVMREIVVAESDAEARRIAKPAHDHLYANQTYLRRHQGAENATTTRAGDFDDAIREGSTIVGTPETVRAEISRQAAVLGFNYFIGYFMFGTMSLPDALRSLRLFATEVMPAFP